MKKKLVEQKGTGMQVHVPIETAKVVQLYNANLKTAKELVEYAQQLEDQAKHIREAAACLMGERDLNT